MSTFTRCSTLLFSATVLMHGAADAARTDPLAASSTVAEEAAAAHSAAADPLDWPNWRGPRQNSTSPETGLVDRWDPRGGEGSNLLWKSEELAGRSTPIVMRGKLYTIVRADPAMPGEGEKVVCVDAATGEKIWENRFNVYLSDVPNERVGWSSCVGDPQTGRVYALGVCGLFLCLDGETGETIWSHPLHEQYGLLSTFGGRTNVPVIFDNLVIISGVVVGWGDTPATGLMAKPAHRFLAFDKATGELVWFNGTRLIPYDTTYSTPAIAKLGGQWALVFGSGDGQVWALQPRTGVHIWNYPFSRRGLNASPIVADDVVYAGHSEENVVGNRMGAVVALDGTMTGDLTGKELWKVEELMVGKSSPLLIDDRLYAIEDGAKLLVLDTKTGKQLSRKALGTMMRSSPLYADGKIYTCTANGRWYILRPTADGVEIVHRLRLPTGEESHGSPIVSHGRIYLPTTGHLYCIGSEQSDPVSRDAKAEREKSVSRDAPAEREKSVSRDAPAEREKSVSRNAPAERVTPISKTNVTAQSKSAEPAHVQVVPCDVLLGPGDTQQFTVRLFDTNGEFIEESSAEFKLAGSGTIDESGTYTAPMGDEHTATIVTAMVGELSGTARVRVVPPLPWKFDFNELDDVPLTWIGGRVRYVLRDAGGERIMVKRDLIPTRPGQPPTKLGTRSRLWMGSPKLSNYTIQADVMGEAKDGKMPDFGLIDQGYTLDLQGASQSLQIRRWAAKEPDITHPTHVPRTIAFPWEPGTWYTLKLTTQDEGQTFRILGKAWPRGTEEPAEWTIEAVDESPQLQGSPGLFGNTSDAEASVDNVLVTPN